MENRKCHCSELSAILNTLPDKVFIISETGVFLDVFGKNDSDAPYNLSGLIGKSLGDVMTLGQASEFLHIISKSLISAETQSHLYQFTPEEFQLFPEAILPKRNQWYEARVQPLLSPLKGERSVVWISRNITESQELKERLQKLSELDDLTELLNRRAFTAKAKQCFGCRKRYGIDTSIVLIDIDYFKSVNDQFGHPFGDEVIKTVSRILIEEARDTDSVGRLGGEEFGVLLNLTNNHDAFVFAERVRSRIEKHDFSYFSNKRHITISLGISSILSTDRNQTDVFHRADNALYKSKHNGRNQITTDIEEIK